MKSVISI